MSVPGIVQSALGEEPVAAQVGLGGEDQLYVTPSRVLIYRGEGLLSDEAIEEYAHRAERVLVSEGRRKAKITLQHDLEGERTFAVQPARLDDVLHPVLAGVLSTAGVTDPGETVKETYRFSELTLIVTSKRLVKHIGNAAWDGDYEEFRFEDTTDLDFEKGSVATQIVMEVNGRRERIKAPNEQAPEVRAHLQDALFEFYDVGTIEEFRSTVAAAEGEASGSAPDPAETDEADDGVAFESGLSPLSTGPGDDEDDHDAADAFVEEDLGAETGESGVETGETGAATVDEIATGEGAGTQQPTGTPAEGTPGGGATPEGTPPGGATGDGPPSEDPVVDAGTAVEDATVDPGEDADTEALSRRLDEIAASVNKQNELLKRHQRTMEKLIDELQRMND